MPNMTLFWSAKRWVMPWFTWLVVNLSLYRPGFHSRPVHMVLVEDTLAQRQVALQVLRFSPISTNSSIYNTLIHLPPVTPHIFPTDIIPE